MHSLSVIENGDVASVNRYDNEEKYYKKLIILLIVRALEKRRGEAKTWLPEGHVFRPPLPLHGWRARKKKRRCEVMGTMQAIGQSISKLKSLKLMCNNIRAIKDSREGVQRHLHLCMQG